MPAVRLLVATRGQAPNTIYLGDDGETLVAKGVADKQLALATDYSGFTTNASQSDASRPVHTSQDTTWVVTPADRFREVRFVSAQPITLRVPSQLSVELPLGLIGTYRQDGAGQITVVGDVGVMVSSPSGSLTSSGATIKLEKVGAQNVRVTGSTSPDNAVTAPDPQARVALDGGASGINAIVSDLKDGRSAALMLFGDSTGRFNNPSWFRQLGVSIGQAFPTHNVIYRDWVAANLDYAADQVIQTGPNGARSVRFGNASTNGRFLTAADVGDFTGDIDLRVDLSMDTWSPAVFNMIAARWQDGVNEAQLFFVDNAGKLNYRWKETGGTTRTVTSTAALGFAAGARRVVRATLVVSTGVATLYTATSMAGPWTQIGTTTVGATSVQNPAGQVYEIGTRGGAGGAGPVNPLIGNIYDVQWRDGIEGAVKNPQPIDAWYPVLTAQSPLAGSPTLWIINGSHSGATLSFLSGNDAGSVTVNGIVIPFSAVPARMAQPFVSPYVYLSCSKNDGNVLGRLLVTAWDAYLANLSGRLPLASYCMIAQSPTLQSGTQGIAWEVHGRRTRQLLRYAVGKGLESVDVYRAFLNASVPLTTLLTADGVHQTVAGDAVWANAVTTVVQSRITR